MAYRDGDEKSGCEYERVVKYVESLLEDEKTPPLPDPDAPANERNEKERQQP